MCSQSGICVRVASASDLATQWLAHCIAIGIDDAISPNMRQTEWLCCCVIYIYMRRRQAGVSLREVPAH